jgi:hypothetical protein
MGALGLQAAQALPGRWLVVTAPVLRGELAPLIEHRRAEGFEVTIIDSTALLSPIQIRQTNAAPLQAYIREWARQTNSPGYVLLVGLPAGSDNPEVERNGVPALLGTVERMKDQLSDYRFAPPAEPGTPQVAIGRFPAQTPNEVSLMVRKTLQLETQKPAADWRRRLIVLAGNPGGGPVAEMVADATMIQRLQRLHASWEVKAISCSAKSRYFVPGNEARAAFLNALEAGGLFTAFMGHSSPSGMWLTGNHYFTRDDWSQVRTPMTGVFFTCGCFALQFRENHDGYGLAAMRAPNGPAAVIGATAESYAAPGLLAADGLLKCLGEPPFPARLADYWLAIQAGLSQGAIDEFTFKLYDQADGSKGKVPLDTQRLEHLEMWMLLGDPALRIPVPTAAGIAPGP